MALGFPFGFRVANPEPLDNKYGPYASIPAALASVAAGERYIGLTVNVNGVEYWWKSGTANGDLVEKSNPGSARSRLYRFNSNLFTEQSSSYRGLISGLTQYLTNELQSISFEVRLDAVSTWTSQADLTTLQTWINANVTGTEATGTLYWIRVLATYKSGSSGEAEVRIGYNASL